MEKTEAKMPTMSEILQEAMTRIKKAAGKNVELETIANDLEKSIKEWDDFVRESDKINTALKKLIDDEGNIIEKSKIHSIGSNIEGLRRWVILQEAKTHINKAREKDEDLKTVNELDKINALSRDEDLKMENELDKINTVSSRVSKWESDFDGEIDKINTALKELLILKQGDDSERQKKINSVLGDIKQLRRKGSSVQFTKVKSSSSSRPPQTQDVALSEAWKQLGLEENIFSKTINVGNLQSSYHNVENHQIKLCLLSLSIFPVNYPIKKRLLIYWWIGEGFINGNGKKTAEEVGEEVFEKLINQGLIRPVVDRHDSWPIVNKCNLHPWIHRMLISLAKDVELFEFINKSSNTKVPKHRRSCLVSITQNYSSADQYPAMPENLWTLFNLSEQYLHFKPDWLTKLKTIEVLQLGRWQDVFLNHIETINEELLKGLGAQKNLKYLSLRGISRIAELPPSIVNLTSLEILELKACHNLETLPNDISLLRKLTHLDVSECYLLERMPTGLDTLTLTSLQVLKGFLIGDSKTTPCRLGDLGKLTRLRRLSIYIGSAAEILENTSSLRCLTITWALRSNSESRDKVKMQSFSFPPDLQKLDLRAFPLEAPPKWLTPTKLKRLKKLYIRGGGLGKFDFGEQDKWAVEILRLGHLKKLRIDWNKLNQDFPCLRYPKKEEEVNPNKSDSEMVES
ncbi:disease resistance RPP13-like protein 4 [Quercus robur]|uniref:disease resistance RPP13-like protein 4 n=1 Tax=Quercus robur TaxID=38942 RepID=UPI002162FAE9|nr:disease resistance RPP13-like protein 4 [Quercus robur]